MNRITTLLTSASKQITRGTTPQIAKTAGPMQTRALSASPLQRSPILLQDQNGFGFARSNPRPEKPRSSGVTEIRGPYYSVWRAFYAGRTMTHAILGDGKEIPGRRSGDVRCPLANFLADFFLSF